MSYQTGPYVVEDNYYYESQIVDFGIGAAGFLTLFTAIQPALEAQGYEIGIHSGFSGDEFYVFAYDKNTDLVFEAYASEDGDTTYAQTYYFANRTDPIDLLPQDAGFYTGGGGGGEGGYSGGFGGFGDFGGGGGRNAYGIWGDEQIY